jgi:hypothetical protein
VADGVGFVPSVLQWLVELLSHCLMCVCPALQWHLPWGFSMARYTLDLGCTGGALHPVLRGRDFMKIFVCTFFGCTSLLARIGWELHRELALTLEAFALVGLN